jgi:hypothetical protein
MYRADLSECVKLSVNATCGAMASWKDTVYSLGVVLSGKVTQQCLFDFHIKHIVVQNSALVESLMNPSRARLV